MKKKKYYCVVKILNTEDFDMSIPVDIIGLPTLKSPCVATNMLKSRFDGRIWVTHVTYFRWQAKKLARQLNEKYGSDIERYLVDEIPVY